jgi:DNA-directed RNA polymerase alpha subunit
MAPRWVCEIDGDVGKANALRIAMIDRLSMVAPSHIVVHENTTSLTDEFIAERIALIPFQCDGADDCSVQALTLHVEGRTASTADLVRADAPTDPARRDPPRVGASSLATPVYTTIRIADMLPGQELHLEIHFRLGCASEHAAFCPTVAVGVRPAGPNAVMSFETLVPEQHVRCVDEAFDALERALHTACTQLEQSV